MTENPSSLARKRRMEIIQLQRNADTPSSDSSGRLPAQDDTLPPKKRKVSEEDPSAKGPEKNVGTETKIKSEVETDKKQAPATNTEKAVDSKAPGKKKEVTTKKGKTQIQYDPGVPMSKEQLAAWRREARRVRNRESAAASRQKIRDRIDELEGEVEQWKAKFNEAMNMINRLEQTPRPL